jgi:hypothetical protein
MGVTRLAIKATIAGDFVLRPPGLACLSMTLRMLLDQAVSLHREGRRVFHGG